MKKTMRYFVNVHVDEYFHLKTRWMTKTKWCKKSKQLEIRSWQKWNRAFGRQCKMRSIT